MARDQELERALARELGTSHPELSYFERIELVRAELQGRPAKTEYLESLRAELAGEREAERGQAEPSGLDEDEADELANLYGVEAADIHALYEHIGAEWANPHSENFDYGRLCDYIEDLAEELDIDEEDIWDIWHRGYYGKSAE